MAMVMEEKTVVLLKKPADNNSDDNAYVGDWIMKEVEKWMWKDRMILIYSLQFAKLYVILNIYNLQKVCMRHSIFIFLNKIEEYI